VHRKTVAQRHYAAALESRKGSRSDAMGFAAFAGQKYLNLESFKKSGDSVKTPVWFAAEPSARLDSNDAKLYVYTIGAAGKLKRIRNNSRVNIAPCDMRGGVKGKWVPARAEILTGAEAEHGMKLLNEKYVPWKQWLDFFAKFRKRERTVFVIRPA
jgi:PPOX class probable F420-dependent enzyme